MPVQSSFRVEIKCVRRRSAKSREEIDYVIVSHSVLRVRGEDVQRFAFSVLVVGVNQVLVHGVPQVEPMEFTL